jgi:(4-alkanoyl-5-oxo-2,5-dihydrofuran-3-yl)methyl phosphate reductase
VILVTGATGNVGQELVPMLAEAKQEIRILVRDEGKAAQFDSSVQRAVGDLDRPETIQAAMKGVTRLYLVTPLTEQVGNLVAAAKAAGVEHIVKQSTIEANRSLGPGRWHREQEGMIEESGAQWTFIRPTLMMSNTAQWWSATIRTQGRVYFPGLKGRAPAVDPKDVAAVACRVLTQPEAHQQRIYEVTGPEPLSIALMIQILSNVLGKPIRYVRIPRFVATLWMRRVGMSARLVKAMRETFSAWDRNEYAYVSDDVLKVSGHAPGTYESWCRKHADLFDGPKSTLLASRF